MSLHTQVEPSYSVVVTSTSPTGIPCMCIFHLPAATYGANYIDNQTPVVVDLYFVFISLFLAGTCLCNSSANGTLSAWSVGRSVGLCHRSEPCKNGSTNRDAVSAEDSGGPRESFIMRRGSRFPWDGTILRWKGASHCKVSDTLRSSMQKELNQSRCRLGCGLKCAQEIMCYIGV